MHVQQHDYRTNAGIAARLTDDGVVVVDKADKSGHTCAVVWQGDLLPVRFNYDDACAHLRDLRAAQREAA